MSTLPIILAALCGATTSGEHVVDDFAFRDVSAARQVWVAKAATPSVELAADPDAPRRTVLQVLTPFATAPTLRRAVVDRNVTLDLAAPGQFILELASDSPEVVGQLTLYFRSGDGWYGADGTLSATGWRTVRFSKASFRTEGDPAGWDRIDGIRIAAWRGKAQDASLKIRRLSAITHDVALVVPNRSSGPDDTELATAQEAADRVGGMLAELGLPTDLVNEAALGRGALGNRRVVVLAYNPNLGSAPAAALRQFVEAGGKVFVCSRLPDGLAATLGFGEPKYVKQQREGQFAEIRFDAPDLPGLPDRVEQASWNIVTAEPAGYNARVIGRWVDDRDTPTDLPAMLVSDRGAFFSHIVLADDREGKKAMLAAVLGRLAPPLWPQMVRAALDASAKVGHCSDFSQIADVVRAHGDANARGFLDAATLLRDQVVRFAGDASSGQHLGQSGIEAYPRLLQLTAESRRLLVAAYLLSQPSPQREGRAFWNHSGTGAYPGDWDRSARELAAAGINMILPNMLWAGQTHYASDVLPRSGTFRRYGDQVAQCVAAAHAHGIEVHVWKVNYNLSGAPDDFVERLRREGRLQVDVQGETRNWLCPSHPANRQLECDSMIEVARDYAVDGLHFDYIRYPGRETCYCDGCRERFEAASGRAVADWPAECYSGPRREEYNAWRCRQITALVAAVHAEAKRLRPELMISAAVYGSYPACRDSVAQDWPEWIEAGYLDFICPMDYTESDEFFTSLVKDQIRRAEGRIPVYAGIGATASNSRLSADRVVGQIHHTRSLGADGFCIFNLTPSSAAALLPAWEQSLGARKATPPHLRPGP